MYELQPSIHPSNFSCSFPLARCIAPRAHLHYIAISTSCNFHEADKCCTHSQQSDQLARSLYTSHNESSFSFREVHTYVGSIVICAIISALSCSSGSRRIARGRPKCSSAAGEWVLHPLVHAGEETTSSEAYAVGDESSRAPMPCKINIELLQIEMAFILRRLNVQLCISFMRGETATLGN